MIQLYYTNPHLGEYIALLQHAVPVEGRLLSEESLARRACMSKTTVERIKKGLKSICMPTTPSFASTGKPAKTARFFRASASWLSFTAASKPITGSVVVFDADMLQDRPGAGSCFSSVRATLAPRNRNFSLYRYKVIE